MPLAISRSRSKQVRFERLMHEYGRNYERLGFLVPALREIEGGVVSTADGVPDLHIEITEQNPYTTTLVLSYALLIDGDNHREPEVLVRAYHDARQAEVLALRDTSGDRWRPLRDDSIRRKWTNTRFLGKWLAYCLMQGHGTPCPRSALLQPAI